MTAPAWQFGKQLRISAFSLTRLSTAYSCRGSFEKSMSYHFDGNGCSYAICYLLHPAVWLEQGKLKQLVLVVTEADTKEVLERWTFDIDTNRDVVEGRGYVNVTQKPLWKGIGCCLDYRVSFCASVPRAAENVDSKCLLVACYPTPCSKINTVSHVCTQIIHPVSIFNES